MQLKKVLTTAAATVAASAMVLGSAAGVAHAGDDQRRGPQPAPATTAAPSDAPATATATIGVQQTNVTVVSLVVSDTATSTITVRDGKRGGEPVTWDVPAGTKVSGHYTRLADVKPGFVVHLKGTRTGAATPVADHVVVPGRNKKVEVRGLTVTAVSGSAGTITVRDKRGGTFTWAVRGAKVEGRARSLGALSKGDVVSVRGETVEGTRTGRASIVRIDKDVKPAKPAKAPKPAKPAKRR